MVSASAPVYKLYSALDKMLLCIDNSNDNGVVTIMHIHFLYI